MQLQKNQQDYLPYLIYPIVGQLLDLTNLTGDPSEKEHTPMHCYTYIK